MTTHIGQNFGMALGVTQEKGGEEQIIEVSQPLPYNMDGVIINLPALLGGAPEDVYMEEFVPAPVEEDEDEEVVVTDEFEMPSEE